MGEIPGEATKNGQWNVHGTFIHKMVISIYEGSKSHGVWEKVMNLLRFSIDILHFHRFSRSLKAKCHHNIGDTLWYTNIATGNHKMFK